MTTYMSFFKFQECLLGKNLFEGPEDPKITGMK